MDSNPPQETYNSYIMQNFSFNVLSGLDNKVVAMDMNVHGGRNGTTFCPSMSPSQSFNGSHSPETNVQYHSASQPSVAQSGNGHGLPEDPHWRSGTQKIMGHIQSLRTEKERAESNCNSLKVYYRILQTHKDFIEKDRLALGEKLEGLLEETRKLQAHCRTLNDHRAQSQWVNQSLIQHIGGLQVANVQLKKDRDYFRKFAEEMFTIIRIAHKEQRPPNPEVIRALIVRAQGPPKPGTESCNTPPQHAESQTILNPIKQSEYSSPTATRASGPALTHQHEEAKIPKSPLTPPASTHDAPTPPAVATQKTSNENRSTSSKDITAAPKVIIDLSLASPPTKRTGVKRSSVDGDWDGSLRAPLKHPWYLTGKRLVEEEARQKELEELERMRAKRVKVDHVDTNTPREGKKKATKKAKAPAPKKAAGKTKGKQHDHGGSGLWTSVMRESSEQLAMESKAEPDRDEQPDGGALGHEHDPEDLDELAKELEAEFERKAEAEAEAEAALEAKANLSNGPSTSVAFEEKSASASEPFIESCAGYSEAELDSLFEEEEEGSQHIDGSPSVSAEPPNHSM